MSPGNSVRAKMRCNRILDSGGGSSGGSGKTVQWTPVTDGSEENREFFGATPRGALELHIENEDALQKFQEGQEYYLDITPAS